MKVTSEQVDPCQVRLTIEVAEERVQGEMRKVARRISRQTRIPGFRKGKAPYDVIAQRFGEMVLREEATEVLIDQAYKEALDREGLLPYDAGSLENMTVEPLTFEILLPLPPVIDLGEYQSVRVDPPTVEVTEEDIDRVVERLRYEYSIVEPVEGRGAEAGDVMTISASGNLEDGSPYLNWDEEEVDLDLENEHPPAPGFYEALLGMEPGETRTFTLEIEIEDDDGPISSDVTFEVELHQLSERTLPDADDDLARVAGDFEELDELREEIYDQMLEGRETSSRESYTDEVLNAVIEQAEIAYPPVMLEDELDRAVKRFESRVRQDLRLDLEGYLAMTDTTEEELRSELLPQAKEQLLRGLVLSEFVSVEELVVSDEEIDERIDEIAATLEERAPDARKLLEQRRDQILSEMLIEKAIGRLTAIARGDVPEEEAEEEEEEPAEEATEVEEPLAEEASESEEKASESEEAGDDA